MSLPLKQALVAFCRTLSSPASLSCSHPHVAYSKNASHCPDCGYEVRFLWAYLVCGHCQAKRPAVSGLSQLPQPSKAYCMQCGHSNYRLVKTRQIEAQTLPYAVCIKETCFEENFPAGKPSQAPGPRKPKTAAKPVITGHVVEGTVVKRRFFA